MGFVARLWDSLWQRYLWAIDSGYPAPASVTSLYRIGFCLYLLIQNPLPNLRWMADYPADFYSPPPGLPAIWGGVLPAGLLAALEIVLIVVIVALLLGVATRYTSLAVGVIGLLVNSVYFSFGKIDHTIIVWLVPLAFAFSGWGEALSIDARRRSDGSTDDEETARSGSRAIFVTGVFLAVSFLTAALPKVAGGWLSLEESAVRAHFLFLSDQLGRNVLLADTFAGVTNGAFWESLDWVTVALELALAFALLWPVLQRRLVLVVWLFHVANLLVLNIGFYGPLPVYPVFFLPLLHPAAGRRIADAVERLARPVVVGGLVVVAAVFAFARDGLWWAVADDVVGLAPHVRDLTFFLPGLVVLALIALRTGGYRSPPTTERQPGSVS